MNRAGTPRRPDEKCHAENAHCLDHRRVGQRQDGLLQRFIDEVPLKLAVLVNEFGEIGIDGAVIRAKNVYLIDGCETYAESFEQESGKLCAYFKLWKGRGEHRDLLMKVDLA